LRCEPIEGVAENSTEQGLEKCNVRLGSVGGKGSEKDLAGRLQEKC
jgi:hypothetical protein